MRHLTLQCFGWPRPLMALPLLWAGLACAQTISTQPAFGAAAMQATTMPPAPSYSIVNLGEGTAQRTPAINRYGQVAYTLGGLGFFYDGARIFQIPGLAGGINAVAVNLNDKGQVVGSATFGAITVSHPFVWSKQAGIRDLLPLDDGSFAEAHDINNYGIAAGGSQVSPGGIDHAVRWTGPGSRLDLGSLGSGRSDAIAINDAGLIAGTSVISVSPPVAHAFAWTPSTGLIDIGTLGGDSSEARAVDEFGEVAGNSLIRISGRSHVFLWTRASGIRDLGADGGVSSAMLFMSTKGRIAGVIQTTQGPDHAMTWTHAHGMKDIGTLPGGVISRAWSANNYGQVVGESLVSNQEPFHAFVWTYASGMIDLNKRVRYLPKGMLLQTALAVSDNGSIVVQTNTGLVLLKPGRCGCGAVVGPIEAPGAVVAGTPYMVSASLADENTAATHKVSWSWGDGSSDPAHNAIERNGEGNASASHVYSKPGTYEVSVKVTDAAGHSATVSRKVVVQGMTAPGLQG